MIRFSTRPATPPPPPNSAYARSPATPVAGAQNLDVSAQEKHCRHEQKRRDSGKWVYVFIYEDTNVHGQESDQLSGAGWLPSRKGFVARSYVAEKKTKLADWSK